MPNYKPLTQEEKDQIVKQHEKQMQEINTFFTKGGLAPLDATEQRKLLEERMNDENMVARYRLSQEIAELDKQYTKAYKDIIGEFKLPTNNYLSRSIKFLLKIDGSEESKNYNRGLLETYTKHPEEFTYKRIKNLMNYDPKELIEIGNDKVKLMEFYKNNMALCNEANEFGDAMNQKALGITKKLDAAKDSFKVLVQKINYGGTVCGESNSLTFFSLPKLSDDKNQLIYNHIRNVFPGKEEMEARRVYEGYQRDKNNESLAGIISKLEAKSLTFNKNPFLKYKALETNPETGKVKEVSLLDYANEKENVTVVERSSDEIERLNNITSKFEIKYSNEFQKRLGARLGKAYNIFNMQKEMAGGFFDRMFRKPSPEFKDFMQRLADFTNPEKEGFLDKEGLKDSIEKYARHVRNNPANNAMREARENLVHEVGQTLAFMDVESTNIRNNINQEIYKVIPDDFSKVKVLAVDEAEVEELKLVEKDNKIDFDDLSIDSDEMNKSV